MVGKLVVEIIFPVFSKEELVEVVEVEFEVACNFESEVEERTELFNLSLLSIFFKDLDL